VTLPEFTNAEEYLEYMQSVSALPKGFATGTGEGTFVSVEAPNLGDLVIRGTVIQLTEGPTDSWAACFTSNKVRLLQGRSFLFVLLKIQQYSIRNYSFLVLRSKLDENI
jgi:hypothetical protein